MTRRVFAQPADLLPLVGEEIAVSDWVEVTQSQVNQFAEATGDHQWIHVDEERARNGPFGGTIAHGFFTLSLLPRLLERAIDIAGVRMGVNYGLNKVRFTDPVPVGSRVRARFVLQAFEPVAGNGVQTTWQVTFEREGAGKPACIAESLVRHYG